MRLHGLGAALLCLFVLGGCELLFNPQDEGTEDSPVVLSMYVTHRGSVSAWGTSYYSFVVAGAPGDCTISLTDAASGSNPSWHLHDSDRMVIYHCDNFDNEGDETDTVWLSENGTYYLRVEEWNWQGTWFDLWVSGP